MRLDRLLDHGGTVRRPSYRSLAREAWHFCTDFPAPPDPATLPDGGGCAVLVIPGFLTGDALTRPLRHFLGRCGFRAEGWGLGVNWGPTPRLLAGLRRRLDALRGPEGAPVALVGYSLGGLLARDLAHDRPEAVACVVTVASPFRLPTASTLAPLVRACAWRYAPDIRPERLALPPGVPTTAIYLPGDGVVAPETCHVPGEPALALPGIHLAACRNPEVLRAVVRALADGVRREEAGEGVALRQASSRSQRFR